MVYCTNSQRYSESNFQDFISSCSSNDPVMDCLPGFFCSNETCKCGHRYPHGIIKCNEDKGTLSVLDCYCATFDQNKNVAEVGACFYNCINLKKDLSDIVYHPLPSNIKQNNSICMLFNRTGALCGRCLPEHYPLAYSFDMTCVLSSHIGWNWGRYIMAAYLPLTVFYCFIVFFQINAVTSHLHPVIWYSQAVSIPAMSRLLMFGLRTQPDYNIIIAKLLLSLYGIWNLDFFRPFYSDICLGIGLLPTLALDYLIAVYPLLLIGITYLLINLHDKNYRVIVIMWKPFHKIFSLFKKNWNIRTSLIDSFATFFLLSNIKFLSVTFDLLTPTHVYELHQDGYQESLWLYYAGNIKYFGKEHLPFALLAIIVSLVFIALPVAILALYPFSFFQKFLNHIPFRQHILHTFMDSFTGCYKDGTEPGTRDCRWFAAVFFFFRLLGFLIFAFTKTSAYFSLCAMMFLLLILLIVNFQPFKFQVVHYSKINVTFFTLLALFYVAASGWDIATIKVQQFIKIFFVFAGIAGTVPLLYALGIIFFWIFSNGRFGLRLAHRIKAWRNGYNSLENNDSFDTIEQMHANHE